MADIMQIVNCMSYYSVCLINQQYLFIINGKIMPGAMDYPDFLAAVNSAS